MAKMISVSVCIIFAFFISSAIADTSPQASTPSTLAYDAGATNFSYVCDPQMLAKLNADKSSLVFCDSSLPYPVRAKDLVDRMTIEEKVQQLGDFAKGVPRLGVPQYKWWSEALHGVSSVGGGSFFDKDVPGATSFPTVILTAASFNETLWKTIGEVVSTEARAMYNLGHAGLTFWSPTINVVRDPRWGRITETPGEDPYVVGRYAVNYVRGLQDVEGTEDSTDLNSRPLKVAACCKHYAGYDVDNWNGIDRYHFDAKVTEQDMLETFLRPFEMCVKDGDVSSVMCSYNRINGIPTCADPKLLSDTIRGEWDLHGYIVADCDSIEEMVHAGYLNDTKEDATAQAIKAGLDLDCGKTYTEFTIPAMKQGKVREADIDKALRYLYVVLMRLGFFDRSPAFESLGKDDVCAKGNIELATEAAREGIVLLKNDDETLPLNAANFKTLAVVGPHGNATDAMIGNYAGIPCRFISPIAGLSTFAQVSYKKGCEDIKCANEAMIPEAVEVAKTTDATIILVGLDLSIEAESLDRTDLLLPGQQTQLITKVTEAAKGPVILVIMAAGGLDISFAKANEKIKAILWVGYPGQEGGRAIAEIIFGTYNPGGRLPITWHEADYVKIPMTSMQLRPIDSLGYPGRTYRFFNGSTVYPFGYGLSYTQFKYNLISSSSSIDVTLNKFQQCRSLNYRNTSPKSPCPAILIDDLSRNNVSFNFWVELQNVGQRAGSQVAIVYAKPPGQIIGAHVKQVIGFKRIFVPLGGRVKVNFAFDASKSLAIVDYNANRVLPSGKHTIMIGDAEVSFDLQVNFRRQ